MQMTRSPNFLDLPDGMNDLWSWVVALDAWDYCDPTLLSDLLLSEKIPDEFRNAIADIIAFRRKPKRKAAAKLKIPAAERMKIAGSCSVVIGLAHKLKTPSVVEATADRLAKEPIEIVRELEAEIERTIQKTAQECGVSTETVENLLRDLRQKIMYWPRV